MKKAIAMIVAAASLAQACVTAAYAADTIRRYQEPDARGYQEPDVRGGVKIGLLTCDVGGGLGYVLGSAKEADCVFSSSVGQEISDHYTGDISTLG
ncbi:DUF992 domain-containing protein, partial [Rhizobium sp. SEMIA 4085]|uniref:DUF992 domain-containing protein n=1 Tax=Rhizobium sp. SEMIA 4085 TaxID=2137761 RepID=UPI00147902C2